MAEPCASGHPGKLGVIGVRETVTMVVPRDDGGAAAGRHGFGDEHAGLGRHERDGRQRDGQRRNCGARNGFGSDDDGIGERGGRGTGQCSLFGGGDQQRVARREGNGGDAVAAGRVDGDSGGWRERRARSAGSGFDKQCGAATGGVVI